MSNMRLLWLVQSDQRETDVVLCAFIWRNLGFIGLDSQQKKIIIVHLYSVQTQEKGNVEIMQYASGAAPPGAGFLLG